MPPRNCAVERARRDREELAAISGVTIAESDEPLKINLYFTPSRDNSARTDAAVDSTFHFRITIPAKYPFQPPSFKWISRPAGAAGHTPFLGPNGDVSISALSQWTPASSLSNVLISLFPSETLAAQCCSVTSHIWLMGEGKGSACRAFTDPQVLHCLADHLLRNEPESAHALHQTCRAAASAVQQAVSKLSVVAQHVDIVHTVHTFSALSQLKCTQCALRYQTVLQVDPSFRLMSSLKSLAVIRCSVESLFGAGGLFPALQALPNLEKFSFEPSTSMLWSLYDNRGQIEFAKNPFGEEQVLALPADVPRPVPDEWASIWVGLATVTQLKELSVTAPLCDMAYAPRDASRQGWSAAARIVHYAFSHSCLSSMPCLRSLEIDLQHVNIRNARPGDALQPVDSGPSASDDVCAWDLPTCGLKTFALSGVALGERQLNYHQSTKDFWGGLEQLRIGHTAVSDDLQATALKLLVYLARHIKCLDVASLEELLSKLASNPMSPVSYVTLSKLESLSTTLVGKLADVQQLTRLELRSCKSYINLNLVAESLPQLRILEGLPFKPGTDHRFYWPLRQCLSLEKLVTLPGPPGAASSIQSVLGNGVHVHVPVWADECPQSQAVFRRGFFPAHRPMLSSYDPLNSHDAVTIRPASPCTDAGGAAYHGYALGRVQSRSPVPHTGDSPTGHSSDSAIRPIASRITAANDGAQRPAADFAMASGAAHVPHPEDAPAGGDARAAAAVPDTPAANRAIQAATAVEDAVLVCAASTADAMQEHCLPGAGAQDSFALGATVRHGLMAGMARWAAGFGRLSLPPETPSADADSTHKVWRIGDDIKRSETAAMGLPPVHPWTSDAGIPQSDTALFDCAEGSQHQSAAAASVNDDPSSPSPTTVYSTAREGEMFSDSDMDLSSSDDDSQSLGTVKKSTVLSAHWSSRRGGVDVDRQLLSGLPMGSPCAWHCEGVNASPADAANVHVPHTSAAVMHPANMDPGLPTIDNDALAINRSGHAAGGSADGAGWVRPAQPRVRAFATGAGPSNASTAPRNLNPIASIMFQPGRADVEPYRRTSSEGGGRMHKRHASATLSGTQHTPSGSQACSAAPSWLWPEVNLEEGRHDTTQPELIASSEQSMQMYEPSPIEMMEAMLADRPRAAPCATASAFPNAMACHPSSGARLYHIAREQAGQTHAPPHLAMQGLPATTSGSVASGGQHHGSSAHNRTAANDPGSRMWLPAEDGSDSDSDPGAQLSAERRRLSTLAIRRSVHSDIRRRAEAREALRQTLGSGPQAARSLLVFGAESTPNGISETPRRTNAQEGAHMSSTRANACCVPTKFATAAGIEDKGGARALHILELPLCPQGHRPTLIAQINAQASPQFEQLGPFLFRIGCCKTCRLQIPSLLDLSVDDVSGTCTDTVLVVSPDLSQAIARSTMQACKRPRSAMQGLTILQSSQQFVVKQVHKHGTGMDRLTIVHSQVAHVAWISCWVPTEPALESPTRNDVQALARAYSVKPPPIGDHPHGRAAARLGGTRATASPACRLCCNRMRLVVTLPCNGSVVCEAQRCSDILQTFKCHLHPQEIQCSWTSMAVEAGRSSSEA